MVKAVLADVNIEGHVDLVMALVRGTVWGEFWLALGLDYLHFDDVGLASNDLDSTIWHTCQGAGYVLVTNNRNEDDAESLQATIRAHSTPDSLPVLPIADAEKLRVSRDYAARIAESLLDILLRVDELRGTGRLYLP